jgi:meiotically up-regulated gene 157 (Mug157) protein
MHNYELDNLAYHLRLCSNLYEHSKSLRAFDSTWLRAIDRILETLAYEQDHERSAYRYPELPNNGKGSKVCSGDGLTWSAFRPSDDKTTYGYLIPSNMMMAVELKRLAQLLVLVDSPTSSRVSRALELARAIDNGIHKHGVINVPNFGRIYAFEVDACGNSLLMDDANLPSLLSIPYLKYTSPHDINGTIAQHTREYVLSSRNKFFYSSKDQKYRGIGSPHTPHQHIWHLALAVQAMTADDDVELRGLVATLEETATNDVMHESFHTDDSAKFTRRSFAWANSLFAEFITTRLDDIIRVVANETNGRRRKKIK